jgi:ion channel
VVELLFLSFTTLTAVGLGDIVPAKPMARALVMLEQLAGLMYIALVVARLIGLTVYDGIKRAEREKMGSDTKRT